MSSSKRSRNDNEDEEEAGGEDSASKSEGEAEESGPWIFSCLCGQYVTSEDPKEKHPQGDQFACDSCGLWCHLNCYADYRIEDENDLEEMRSFCRKCRPLESPLFNVSALTLEKILRDYCSFEDRKACSYVNSLMYALARAAQRSLRLLHSNVDVACHVLQEFQKVDELTLFCWSARFAKVLTRAVTVLRIISAAPNFNLPGVPKSVKHLEILDASVSEAGLLSALGRASNPLTELTTLNVSCTSVSGQQFALLLPLTLKKISLCCTAVQDVGALAILQACPNLEEVDFSHTFVSDALFLGWPFGSATAESVTPLSYINLSYTSVSGEGLERFFPRLNPLNHDVVVVVYGCKAKPMELRSKRLIVFWP